MWNTNPLQAMLGLDELVKDARGLRFTPREIAQQPDTWKETYAHCLGRKAELAAFLKTSGIWGHDPAPMVLLIGAGSSDYIGRCLVRVLRRHWRCDVAAVPSTDILLDMDSYLLAGREQLWISFSRSGDSPEGVAVLKGSLQAYSQVRHLVVTCNAAADMVRLCSENRGRALSLVLGEAVNDRGLAMTSSFTNMVVAGQFLAHLQDLQAYGEIIEDMASAGARLLATGPKFASLVVDKGLSRACFVGSNALAAVAAESALKLLELTGGRIQTMSESTLGLRHGPMSAIDEKTLFVQFLSSDRRFRSYETDLLEEVARKNLGGARVVLSGQPAEGLAASAGFVLSLDVPVYFPDDCRPPLDVILGQLLGLFASVRAGLQPDSPSPSGTISRVVSGVRIYS